MTIELMIIYIIASVAAIVWLSIELVLCVDKLRNLEKDLIDRFRGYKKGYIESQYLRGEIAKLKRHGKFRHPKTGRYASADQILGYYK